MIVGKAPGGGNLVVGGGDGGAIPPEAMPDHKPGAVGNQSLSSVGSSGQAGSGTRTLLLSSFDFSWSQHAVSLRIS